MGRPRRVMEVQMNYRVQAFTADLTAHEFWLALNKGFQPLGIVTGYCTYAMGSLTRLMSTAKGQVSGEVKVYTEFLRHARAVALARAQFQADRLGADGVIGIDMEVKYLHHDEWMQVTVSGTAVRYVGTDGGKQGQVLMGAKQAKERERGMPRPQSMMDVQADYRGRAFTSNLSSDELWLMLEAG